ncbi:hypothetical protein MASR1M90_04230 [Desulfovibrionales bacterium]
MAYMVLLRIPKSEEINIECEDFLNAFHKNEVRPFVAKLEDVDETAATLGEWHIFRADWFEIQE